MSSNNSVATMQVAVQDGNTLPLPAGGSNEQLQIMGQLKSIEQINEQRRIFLENTITENDSDAKVIPPSTLPLNVKYATLPGPTAASLRSPVTPPPKPPMLSRTRSTGSGDGRTPSSPLGPANGDAAQLRHSLAETTTTTKATTLASKPAADNEAIKSSETSDVSPLQGISFKHYEGLVEELRCPGCACAMKAPVLLCKSGHSVCEQCTRILLMCPLCKEPFTRSRSLTVEALCAKAHFRCNHAAGGCAVRMPVALLPWHEQQCIYKPMKCFMGRVWGDCKWQGREIQWKQHVETEHADKVFKANSKDLIWNLAERRKPLTGYYVFQAHDEMFNFYEIHDKQRVLFTMTCTSNRRAIKYNYAYEVTLQQPDNESLSFTQKFPVHSEYDNDILMEGTCVSIGLAELARFVDEEKLLHYRVSVLAVKSPRRSKAARLAAPREPIPIDYQQTQIAGVNVKSVPSSMIITRTYKKAIAAATPPVSTTESKSTGEPSDSEQDASLDLELERKWGTPQLHFNRKYLKNSPNDTTGAQGGDDELSPLSDKRLSVGEDKVSLCSTSTSYTRKMSDQLRKSFRALKTDLIELRPFSKKSAEKQTNGNPVSKANSNNK